MLKKLRAGRWRSGVLPDVLGYVSEQALRLALTAAAGVFVARYLGPENLGLLGFAGGVFGLLTPLAVLGMSAILVREFSTQQDWRPTFVSALGVQAVAAVALAVMGFLIVVVARGFERDAVLLGLVMLPVPILGLHQSVRSWYEATNRVRRVAFVGICAGIAGTAWRIGGLLAEAPVWVFGAAASVEALVLLTGLLRGVPVSRHPTALRRSFNRDIAARLLAESWPLLLAALAIIIYMKSDLLMLGVIAGNRETGIYTAAARLSEVWYFIPMAAAAAVRPRLARMYAAGQLVRYRAATQRFMTALTGIAFVAIGIILLLSDEIIGMLYGSIYLPASPILRIHILAAPFVFLYVAGGQWFIDRNLTRAVMRRSIAGAVLNVVFNLLLIPTLGAMGASIATLIAYASSVAINLGPQETRPLFWMQLRGLMLRWPELPDLSQSPFRHDGG